jgi:hypothetical protein
VNEVAYLDQRRRSMHGSRSRFMGREREREKERKKENGLGEMKEGVYKGFVASISGLIKKKRELRATQAVVWWP